jgi:hypothetical protein
MIYSLDLIPGTKLLVKRARVASGTILLDPQNCQVLGGIVRDLELSWKANRVAAFFLTLKLG